MLVHGQFIILCLSFRAPEGVMMCVMPVETEHDDLVHMQHVLIEAHCREHRITLVKVSMILPTNNIC